jgi:hypothetical protein
MHNSKECFKCNIRQPLSMFYAHPKMADGHLNKCKECTKKDTKENIAKNPDYYRDYDKSRAMNPNRVAERKRYSQTKEGRESKRKSVLKWQETNLVKRSAHLIVQNAVRSGRLIKPNRCELCSKKTAVIHGHHDDYDYPLDVKWVCPKCHRKIHEHDRQS